MPLIDAADSILLVIDVQPRFLARVEEPLRDGLTARIGFLATSARHAGIPALATVESPADWGGLHDELVEPLAGAPVIDKGTFGLADDPAVWPLVEAAGRRTAILTGLETDVCVAQSALGLLDRGFTVVCVADAVASPGTAHAFGLERMRAAGVVLAGTKQVHYEWMRTVAASRAFRAAALPGGADPPGVVL